MEELKNKNSVQSAVLETKENARKDYVPPTAEVILLVPEEQLSVWDYKYSDSDSAADRWAIGIWGGFESCPASGAIGGITNPDGWGLPASSSSGTTP